MNFSPSDPVLPIVIIPFNSERSPEIHSLDTASDGRYSQVEEFLQRTGKVGNTQRTYRGQLYRFATWCNKSWSDVTPSDINQYRRQLKGKGLKPASVNHALNTLRSFYQWLRRSNAYPENQPLPTEPIHLEQQQESQVPHLNTDELSKLWMVLQEDEGIQGQDIAKSGLALRNRAIIAMLSLELRVSDISALNVKHWDGCMLMVHRPNGQVIQVPLSSEMQQYLEAYLEWRHQQGDVFTPAPESPMFLCQDPKNIGQRLGYKGLHRMVKKLGAIAGVEQVKPYRFRKRETKIR